MCMTYFNDCVEDIILIVVDSDHPKADQNSSLAISDIFYCFQIYLHKKIILIRYKVYEKNSTQELG